MIKIDSLNSNLFLFNGVETPRNYEAIITGSNDDVEIVALGRVNDVLLQPTKYSLLEINGETPNNVQEAATLLNRVVFKKGGVDGEGSENNLSIPYQIFNNENVTIYDDLIAELKNSTIEKLGNPTWNQTTYTTKNWNNKNILMIGDNNEADGNGLQINSIPLDRNTLWIRVLGERWNVFKITDSSGKEFGLWCGGYRNNSRIAPNGGSGTEYWNVHHWLPVNIKGHNGTIYLVSKEPTSLNGWISGLAFTQNPLNIIWQSGMGIHWNINGGSGVFYESIWNNDVLVYFEKNQVAKMQVPVIENKKDKILFFILHGSNWNEGAYNTLKANGVLIEDRLTESIVHPYASLKNANSYNKYIGIRIPNEVISGGENDKFIEIEIDNRESNRNFYFREVGTHDFPKWLI